MTRRSVTNYLASVALFEDAVSRVPPGDWDRAALGAWTVRELVGHMTSSIVTVTELLASPVSRVDAAGRTTVDWLLAVLASPDLNEIVAQDGVSRGADLGTEPAERVARLVEEVHAALTAHESDPVVVDTIAGEFELGEFLGTRVVELVIHTVDLSDALQVEVEVEPELARTVLQTLTGLLLERGDSTDALRVLSGRIPLRGRVNALAPVVAERAAKRRMALSD